jgi:glycolate dehydrogenase FAD-binding subunit
VIGKPALSPAKGPKRGAKALDALALGALKPSRIIEPANGPEVAATLRAAADAGEAVVAWGGGTLQTGANDPTRYDVALLTKRLDAVHDYDPRDLTAGLGAGMTLETLARTLGEHGQFVPFDAPLPARATLGGTLAAGWAGPRRATYGRPRDLLIGTTVALADGTLVKSGGMVVKNVTGYDMSKLYVGSHGTLGVLVRANFKVLPAPAACRLAVAPFEDDVRDRLVAHVVAMPLAPVALLLNDGFAALRERRDPRFTDERPLAVALFEGTEATVERAVRDYRSALGAAGVAETRILDGRDASSGFQSVLDEYVATAGKLSFTLLGRGLPSDAAPRAQRVRDTVVRFRNEDPSAGYGVDVITDLLTGDVVARFHAAAMRQYEHCAEAAEAIRDALRGRATLIGGGRSIGTWIDAWGDAPTALATMRTLKAHFDPHGALAPGRYVGGI